ncbi:hypothetical protein IH601_04630 [Candidatus Bipolaricaulota bacterium]|nr:hypothetical protein [Candidatus Bipolaricaulota bacterium]
MRRGFLVILAIVVAATAAYGQATIWTNITASNQTQEVDNGLIDWSGGYILATGMAVPPPDSISEAHGKLQAREAALQFAYLRLAEIIEGIEILGVTTVRDYMLEEQALESIVAAEVSMAQIVPSLESWDVPDKTFLFFFKRPGKWQDGEYHVTIQYNFLERLPMTIAPFSIDPRTSTVGENVDATPYSGLILDALGFDLQTTLYVRLVDPDENEVAVIQGLSFVPSAAYKLSMGAVSVARAESDPRVGTAPLTVDVSGVGADGHSLVISHLSADLIRQMQSTSDILLPSSQKVIIVTSSITH